MFKYDVRYLGAAVAGLCGAACFLAGAPASEAWRFDRLDRIGGHKTTLLGHPHLVNTAMGKAVKFNGIDDAIFLNVHPLADAQAFTWEVIFRPDTGGAAEQRFFHLQPDGSDDRMLFEIRLAGDRWCLDSFAKSGTESRALLDRTKLHPTGKWFHAAAVYDGREFRNYVDGVLQGAGELHLTPQKPGALQSGFVSTKRTISRVQFSGRACPGAHCRRRNFSGSKALGKLGHRSMLRTLPLIALLLCNLACSDISLAPPPQRQFIARPVRAVLSMRADASSPEWGSIIRDVLPGSAGTDWRWTRRHPEFEFKLKNEPDWRLNVRLTAAGKVLDSTGPQNVAFVVNSVTVGEGRLQRSGPFDFSFPVSPAVFGAEKPVRVRLDIDPCLLADSATEGALPFCVLLHSVGFVKDPL